MSKDLATIKRLAEWIEPWGRRWGVKSGVWQSGPVIELELGDRAAAYFIHSPSAGTFRDLAMSK